MRDPYQVLGVGKAASEAEIKRAFRKLAKQHHPDQNPDDPKAKERFAEISSAYDLLSDKDKRAAFDRGEIDAEGKPRFHGFEGFSGGQGGFQGGFGGGQGGFETFTFRRGGGPGGGDTADIFADLFSSLGGGGRRRGGGGQAAPKGDDLNAEAVVPFLDWARGNKVRLTLPTGRELEVRIPAGIEEGKTIRLKGQGMPSPFGGEPGDALITVRIEPHARFRAEGRDIRVEVPITVYEAVLGGKVPVPTLDGTVELTVPPKTTGTRTMRLRGKGIDTGKHKGDMLVSLKIVLPEKVDEDLEAFARRMRDGHPYDPRG